MNRSQCCDAMVFNVSGQGKIKYLCSKCRKNCKVIKRESWKDVYKGR